MRRALEVLAVVLLAGCAAAPSPTLPGGPAATGGGSPSASAPVGGGTSWLVVALGDSIGYNSPMACSGCTGFVDQYAQRLQEETGHAVEVKNLTTPMLDTHGLLDQLRESESRRAAVAAASAVIVSIGFNDVPWIVSDDSCDAAAQWADRASAEAGAASYTEECASAAAERLRPLLDAVYAQVVELRAGQPTILLALNRYNDNIGWCENRSCPWGPTTPGAVVAATRLVVDAWDRVICETAEKHGFACVDVYHAFNGPQGTDAAGDLLATDYTHPSQLGNDRIAELLAEKGYAPLWP